MARHLLQAVRPLPITICSVARAPSPAAQALAGEWRAKLSRYVAVQELVIRPNPRNVKDPLLAREHEADRVLAALPARAHVVALDERGSRVTSPGLAELLAAAPDAGRDSIVFLIGGPHGHGAAIARAVHAQIRLSDMVLNHQLAHILLLEQLYRAWTILRGSPYHH